MERRTLHPHLLNPYTQTLLSNPLNHVNKTSQKKAMDKFQRVIFKLAETHPNAPLTPAGRTLLGDRLRHFVSQHKTPDHPPYSAMIERALRELNEKAGSNEDSISKFLERGYENLPWAHSVLLKHHLEKLCESGDIVMTRNKRYMLAGENPTLNSRAKVKKKRQKRKLRWDWGRESRPRKKQLIKNRNQKKCEKVEEIKKHQESDEKKQQLTENGVHGEDKQVKEDQTKRSLNYVCDNRSYFLAELQCETAANIKKHLQEEQVSEQSEHNQAGLSSPEKPPGFELVRVESSPHLGSRKLEVESAKKYFDSSRTVRQLTRWSRGFSEPKSVTLTSADFVTTPQPEKCNPLQMEHPNLGTAEDQAEQMSHEKQQSKLDTNLEADERNGRRRKMNSKQTETVVIADLQRECLLDPYKTMDSPKTSSTLNQLKFLLSKEQEPQELLQQPPPQKEEISEGKQLRRSLRVRLAKPDVAEDAKVLGVLQPQHRPFYTHQCMPSKRKLGNQLPLEPINATGTDELQHQVEVEQPPKCQRRRRLFTPEPDATDMDGRSRQDLQQQSGIAADCTSPCENMEARMETVLPSSNPKQNPQEEQPKKRRLGRPPKHCSAASPLKDKMKSPETEIVKLLCNTTAAQTKPKCHLPGRPPKHPRRRRSAKPHAS